MADPALFDSKRLEPGGEFNHLSGPHLMLEYLDQVEKYPTPFRMIKGHAFKLLGPWLTEFVDLRDELNMGKEVKDPAALRKLAEEVLRRIEATGRDHPVPKLSEKQLAKLEAEAALKAAIEEQNREETALKKLKTEGCWDPANDCDGAANGVQSEHKENGGITVGEPFENKAAEEEKEREVAVAVV